MKKFIMAGLFSAAMGLAVYHATSASGSDNFSSMEMANIEALTDNENGGQTVSCYCTAHWFSQNVCAANASGAYCGSDPCSNHDGNCRN